MSTALMTDGSRIYFAEQNSQQHGVIAQVSVTGGPVSPLATFESRNVSVIDYSPVRSELLMSFGPQSPLSALGVPGSSTPRRLSDFPTADATWSPDGQFIVYGRVNELDIGKVEGGALRKLATVQGYPVFLRWSPDGKVLRFTLSTSDNVRTSLWEIAADGSNLHPLFPDWQIRNDYGGSWSRDGRYFIYTSFLPNGHGSIFVIREKKDILQTRTPQPVELTSGPMSFWLPLLSIDSKKIFTIGYLDQGQLMRYDGETRAWVPYLSGVSAADADFSRSAEWVTYVLVPEGTLWRSRVDGSERVQLTIPPLRTSMPRWSPDGKHIVFVGLKPDGVWTIGLIPAEGGAVEELAVPDKDFYQDPNWSPDGGRLVLGESNDSPRAIHILDLQSRRVSDLPESQGLVSPNWSPDGRFILALRAGSKSSPRSIQTIMLFDVTRQKWQELCQAPTADYAVFSHSGKYVYFSDAAAASIYRVRMGDTKVQTVVKIDAPGGMKKDDFWYWTGLAPDDSPMFLRDASTREIYAVDVDFP